MVHRDVNLGAAMGRLSFGLKSALVAAVLANSPPSAAYDVRDYLRWDRNGRLDERLLMRRYMPVSSFRYGRSYYGYPYSVWGGMREPPYYPADPYSFAPPYARY
jgi:hypothetical protein